MPFQWSIQAATALQTKLPLPLCRESLKIERVGAGT